MGNQLYPVTIPGEVLAFFLMLFAIGVFSYLTSSIASALIGGDAAESDDGAQGDDSAQGAHGALGQSDQSDGQPRPNGAGPSSSNGAAARPAPQGVALSPDEIATLRALLDRLQQRQGSS